ncbi:MAG: trigger factor [Candidatus Nitricoxidivorans perseverans]|uniref:Trigger factor n=1 Tax=Candidatus Nitricoxidivorans perseverans TaxID=2975601 RepID=A0AA49FMI6_9PROT|nr:MAG: trigger factor [Candidatus Nitricoxidivorans perseverans]
MQTQENTGVQANAASTLERRIDMAVSMADIDREVGLRLQKISRTVKMAGFRPGKVPMKLVAQQYGDQARSEAIGAAVEKAFGEAVRAGGLRVAGYPRIEPKPAGDASRMEFTAIFEVYPDIVLADMSGHEVEKPVLVVGDAEVDQTIEVLRKQRVEYVPAGRAAGKDDRAVIDFTGRRNGEVFEGGTATDYPVTLGAGMMLPDFEAALDGISEGDSKTFDVAFPADYHATHLAGQTVQFEVTCKRVEMPRMPDLDENFARALGIADGDLVRMREEVKANLEREVRKRLHARIKNQVMDVLLAANPIEVPKAMVELESRQMAEKALKDLEARGMNAKAMPVEPSWFADQASRRVKLGLILAELVQAKELQPRPEQVRAVVEDYAQTFEDPQDVVRWYYSQPQRLAEAEALATENNVVDWMLSNARVTEKATAFDELMGNAA